MAYAPSEDSDQPGHSPSLIRVFAVRLKKTRILSYQLSAQQKDCSDWADAQADLSLRWAHRSFCWFGHEAAHFFLRVLGTITWWQPSRRGSTNSTSNTTNMQQFFTWNIHYRITVLLKCQNALLSSCTDWHYVDQTAEMCRQGINVSVIDTVLLGLSWNWSITLYVDRSFIYSNWAAARQS